MNWLLYVGGWLLSTMFVLAVVEFLKGLAKVVLGAKSVTTGEFYDVFIMVGWTAVWIWLCWKFF